jgi:nucleoside diphosphate kinase
MCTTLTLRQDAEEFYAEHKGKGFFPGLVEHMTSDPCLVMVLRRDNAIKEWRSLMGPTNPNAAREAAEKEHPLDDADWPLRALFGDAGPRNATHGSDSPFSALREISFFFPAFAPRYERAVAVVTADAAARVDAIVAELEADDFVVIARASKRLSHAEAGAVTSDAALHDALCNGDTIGLVLEGVNAQLRLRLRVGPSVTVAKASGPTYLRSLFGTDDKHYAVVAADDTAAALHAYFPAPLPLERTLALIKPGVARQSGEAIVKEIHGRGFTVLAESRLRLSRGHAEAFLAAYRLKPYFDTLVSYMTSDDVIALALEKPGAIRYDPGSCVLVCSLCLAFVCACKCVCVCGERTRVFVTVAACVLSASCACANDTRCVCVCLC